MKFAHLADCHLGSWRHPELRELNLESFKKAIEISIKENVEFVLIAGDLFDSAYPPIEILEETFSEIKKLKEKNIACYYIAGSHDYSASGKTFLSVLEKAGFCKNIYSPEEKNNQVYLLPVLHKNVALYGYPGKKSGLEVEEIKNLKLQEAPGLFRILSLHTCISDAVKTLPIPSVKESDLPDADYYALGHLHINYEKDRFVYGGPIFPNNFQELEELEYGRFYIIETSPFNTREIEIKLKDVEVIELEITNALTATEKIINEISKKEIKDKIILLKLSGKITQGKISSIDFKQIENLAKEKGAYILLKSTSKLISEEPQVHIEVEDKYKLEEEIIKKYIEEDKSKFNNFVFPLINSLSLEKQEGETTSIFNSRIFSDINKILNLELKAE